MKNSRKSPLFKLFIERLKILNYQHFKYLVNNKKQKPIKK